MNTQNIHSRKIIPAVNIIEGKKDVILEAEMAGLNKDEVSVDIKGGILTITGKKKDVAVPEGYELIYGERKHYEYERSFELGSEVDRDNIQAKYENGILKVTLSRSEEKQPKKINIV